MRQRGGCENKYFKGQRVREIVSSEKMYAVALAQVKGLGPRTLSLLRNRMGSWAGVWEAPYLNLKEVAGDLVAQAIYQAKKDLNPAREWEKVEQAGVKVLLAEEDDYPALLKEIKSPPPVLFWRGREEAWHGKKVAVVGARKATPYGRRVARLLGRELARAGVVVVSGMARGIDAEAHWGCLEGQGLTVGVLGNGPDVIYPKENRELFLKVGAEGLLLSEFVLGTPPEARNFPVRNRIIAGMVEAVVVVEAALKSGALITVDFALSEGREVLVVPGPITSPLSQGTNRLIQEGAYPLCSVDDVLERIGLGMTETEKRNNDNTALLRAEDEHPILKHIGIEPVHIDRLLELTGINPGVLVQELLELELSGKITSLPGNLYVRV